MDGQDGLDEIDKVNRFATETVANRLSSQVTSAARSAKRPQQPRVDAPAKAAKCNQDGALRKPRKDLLPREKLGILDAIGQGKAYRTIESAASANGIAISTIKNWKRNRIKIESTRWTTGPKTGSAARK